MAAFNYRAPRLDTSFASAIGDGFANAGTAAINYDTTQRNNALLKQKQNLAQSKFDQTVADKNNKLGAYASMGANTYPDLAAQSGYDPQNPNVMTANKFGSTVQAKMEFDNAQPKLQTVEGTNNHWTFNPSSGAYKRTDMPVYRDPNKGLTSDEKMIGRQYGFGTDAYKAAINNIVAKKQMIVVQGENGQEQYVLPNSTGGANAPQVIGTKKIQERPSEKSYAGVNAMIKSFSDLDYLNDNFKDDYVGFADGKINEFLRKAGVPESGMTGNKGYSLFQQALGNLNNKDRNELMGAVLTPGEIAAFNKQTVSEDDDNLAFKQKLERKRSEFGKTFEAKYNQLADQYGEEEANKMFETSKRLQQYQSNRQERRNGATSAKPKITQQEASAYMEELKRVGIIK